MQFAGGYAMIHKSAAKAIIIYILPAKDKLHQIMALAASGVMGIILFYAKGFSYFYGEE